MSATPKSCPACHSGNSAQALFCYACNASLRLTPSPPPTPEPDLPPSSSGKERKRRLGSTFIGALALCAGGCIIFFVVPLLGGARWGQGNSVPLTDRPSDYPPGHPSVIHSEGTNHGTERKTKSARIRKAQYDQLRTGMTYQEAVRVLGHPGVELERMKIAGEDSAIYTWADDRSKAKISLLFQNGKMIQRAQFGLN